MSRPKLIFPKRTRMSIVKFGKRSWVCRLFDFMGQIIFTDRGPRYEDVKEGCCRFRDEYYPKEKQFDRDLKAQKGEKWQFPTIRQKPVAIGGAG